LTTAKTAGEEENRSTAKDAKSAKKEGETNGTSEFADQPAIEEGERPRVTVDDSEDMIQALESATVTLNAPSPICEPRTRDQGRTWLIAH
jgi:hypothetical protein